MRALLPASADSADPDVDLHAHYATDWIERGGLRVNFVSSIDGAATTDGRSRGLQTPGDNRIFAALRDLADVVLIGAGTARAENYQARPVAAQRSEVRQRYNITPDLPIAVISKSLNLDPTSNLFAPAGPRTIVLTCNAANPDARSRLDPVADVAVCGETEVELANVQHALRERGRIRVLCEGGPHLFAELLGGGLVDELCLSVTPILAGPGATRITAGHVIPEPIDAQLHGLLEEDGALFCRYRIARE